MTDLDVQGQASPPFDPELVAAVDLGSNSFHMIVARHVAGELRVVNRLREHVCIAAGLDGRNFLTEEAQERALESLHRFGEQLRSLTPGHVRAVGTNTLRKAQNARAFLLRAEQVLGHPIEIISGQEEGRLTYLGVCHSTPYHDGYRLVIDIGGGSTECILGKGFDVLKSDSLYMGCVSYSLRFFPGEKLSRDAFRSAEIAARQELQGLEETYHPTRNTAVLGTSGTVHAVARILEATGLSTDGITLEALHRLQKMLLAQESMGKVDLPELKDDRRSVLPGGLAILLATMESFGIAALQPAPGALREGLLHDLEGRFRHEDIRDRTIRAVLRRFHVDEAQGMRVEKTVLDFYDQVGKSWNIGSIYARMALSWGARLHEIGLAIAHSGYHKHGEYLLMNAEMAGFSRDDQIVIAALVRNHRRKLLPELLEDLPHLKPKEALRLLILLRLAVLLHRARSERHLPVVELKAEKSTIEIAFPGSWLETHPLTQADLEQESEALALRGYELLFH